MWGGHRFSVIRVIIALLLIVAAFCAGSEFGEMKGAYRSERGYGYGSHERYMRGYDNYDAVDMQTMMQYHNQMLRANSVSVTGTTSAK
jgi:hypothetical protein